MATKFLPRRLLLPVLLAAVLTVPLAEQPGAAQQIIRDAAAIDKADANAYRMIFRAAAAYKKISDDAEAAHQDKSDFRHILASRFELSDDDSAKLETAAIDCLNEIAPLHARTLSVTRKFRSRFPHGIVQPGMDTSPPPELAVLQAEEDAIVLRYRDLLQNEMKAEDFQRLQERVRHGPDSAFSTPQPKSPNTTEGSR